jgi:CRISPR/Cas system-associated protein Csx1
LKRYAAFEKRLKRENKENRTNADSTSENRIREIALKNREVEGVKKNWQLPELNLKRGKIIKNGWTYSCHWDLMAIFNFLARNVTILANFTAAVTFLLLFGW